MKMSNTTLKELTAQYKAVLKKCFLINMGIFFVTIGAFAKTIDSDQNWNAQTAYTELNNQEEVIVNADVNVESNNSADNAYINIGTLTLNNGSSFSVTTTGGEVEQGSDSPNKGVVYFNLNELNVENGASLSLSADKDHTSDISDVATATINGNVALNNSRIEGDLDNLNHKMTIDGADITLTGDYGNMESGQITISDSTINASVLDHGFVSTKDFDVSGATINLNRESHLISTDGTLNLENSTLELTGGNTDNLGSFLYGNSLKLNGTSLTTKGINYLFALNNGISLDKTNSNNTVINVDSGSVLSVYELTNSISTMDDNFDEGHDTVSNIINSSSTGGFKEALGTKEGKLTIKEGVNLNVSGTLRADLDAGTTAGTLNIQDTNAVIEGNVKGVNINVNADYNFNNISELDVDTGLGNVTIAANKKLTLQHTDHEGLILQGLNMNSGSSLEYSSSVGEPTSDSDVLTVVNNLNLQGKIKLNGGAALISNATAGNISNADLDLNDANFTSHGNVNMTNVTGKLLDADIDVWKYSSNAWTGTLTLSGNDTDLNLQDSEISAIDLKVENGIYNLANSAEKQTSDEKTALIGEKTAQYTGGTINMANAMVGADGENSVTGNVESHTNGTASFGSGNILNVNSGDNYLMGETITLANNTTIAKGAILNAKDGVTIDCDNDTYTYGNKSDVTLIDTGIINLSGTLNANLQAGTTAGILKINDSSAVLDGDMTAINLVINSDYNTEDHLQGVVNNIGNLTINEGKKLTLNLKEALTGSDNDLNIKSFTMADNSSLILTGTGTESPDLEASDSMSVTGKVSLDHAGLKLSNSTGNTFNVENATVSLANDSSLSSRAVDKSLDITNSSVMMEESGIYKETGAGDVNINNSSIVMSKANGNGAAIYNSTTTGDINITNGSSITMNANSSLAIGDVSYDDANNQFAISALAGGHTGDIKVDGAQITMNDTSILAIADTDNGSINLNNGTTLNINGNNKLYSESVDVSSSSIKVKEGAVLSVLSGQNKGDVALGTGSVWFKNGLQKSGAVLDVEGTVNANITGTGGIYLHSNDAVINGDISGASYLTLNISNKKLSDVLKGSVSVSSLEIGGNSNIVYDKNGMTLGTINLSDHGVLALNNDTTFNTTSYTIVDENSTLDIADHILTEDILTIEDHGTLAFKVTKDSQGQVIADHVAIATDNTVQNNTTLKMTMDQGVLGKNQETDIQVIKSDDIQGEFKNLAQNARYEFTTSTRGSGWYHVKNTQSAEDIIVESGADSNTQKAAAAWLDQGTFEENTPAAAVADRLNVLSQNSPKAFAEAVKALKPDTAPTAQATAAAINNQIAGAVGGRFGGPAPQGRSSGDTFKNAGLWAQGLMNKSKLDKTNGFDGKTYGLALGFDAEVIEGLKLGLGYAYINSDVDSTGRNTDVDTHTAILYGEKEIGNAFVNGVFTYGRSDYAENKNVAGLGVKADYNADSIFGQLMTGYNFTQNNLTLTPEGGIRYLWNKTHDYTDSADQHVASNTTDTLTGVLGARASMPIKMKQFALIPELKLAATYDIKNDEGGSSVVLGNGSSYSTTGETLKRFGVETGAKVGMTYGNSEISLNYEGKFRQDYSDHTGMVNFKYNF